MIMMRTGDGRSGSSTLTNVMWVAIGFAAVFVVSVASVRVTPLGSDVAAWWPAAGLSVLLALQFRARQLWVVLAVLLVVAVLANIVAGCPPAVAIGYGLANTVEAWLGALLLRDRTGRLYGLDSIRGLIRILITAISCGAAAAIIAGLTASILAGGNFLQIVGSVLPAHAAAVLLITPLALRVMPGAHRASLVEAVAQWAAVIAAVALVFGVNENLPIAFLPYASLVWGATRLSMRSFQVQLLLVGVTVAALSALGRGPFGVGSMAAAEFAAVVQVYLLTSGLVFFALAVLVGAQRQHSAALESSEEMFRESFSSALIGMVIAVRGSDGLRVDRANSVAINILQLAESAGGDPGRVFTEPSRAALDNATPRGRGGDASGWHGQLETLEGKVIGVYVAPLTSLDSDHRFAIQFADVSEKAMAERALLRAIEYERKAGARLRSLDSMKDSLISSVSHELRTPLAGILGYSEMLLDGDGGRLTPEQTEMIAIIERSGQRLSRIVADLLTMSQIETSKSRADTEWLDPAAVARAVCSELRPLADSKKHRLAFLAAESQTDGIAAVPDDIHKIVTNLVANAIKYTQAGGTVEVTVRVADEIVHIDVVDNGIGIAVDDHQKVFGQFYRANTGDDGPSGTGLGLAIVDALVRRNGGSVTVDSDIGRGTRMTVSFPLMHNPASKAHEVVDLAPSDPASTSRAAAGADPGRRGA